MVGIMLSPSSRARENSLGLVRRPREVIVMLVYDFYGDIVSIDRAFLLIRD